MNTLHTLLSTGAIKLGGGCQRAVCAPGVQCTADLVRGRCQQHHEANERCVHACAGVPRSHAGRFRLCSCHSSYGAGADHAPAHERASVQDNGRSRRDLEGSAELCQGSCVTQLREPHHDRGRRRPWQVQASHAPCEIRRVRRIPLRVPHLSSVGHPRAATSSLDTMEIHSAGAILAFDRSGSGSGIGLDS